MSERATIPRRTFLQRAGAAGLGLALGPRRAATAPAANSRRRAMIAITLDLEMSRNFPTADQTNWDYEKGNLDADTKGYAQEAARRVRAHGGVIHFFALGRTLEQEDVGWLKEIAAAGHPIGNHTYDHVALRAATPEETQFRFRRAPWLIAGKSVHEILGENIRLTTAALKTRLGVEAAGFRAPGGFRDGLQTRPDLQKLLQESGFTWASTFYPAHPITAPGVRPNAETFRAIADAALATQPFVYPGGLIEVPMSPISDVGAFRNAQWTLDEFLEATRMSVERVIAGRAVFDFLGHPSVLCVKDPEFRTIELICALTKRAAETAAFTDLAAVARTLAPGSG